MKDVTLLGAMPMLISRGPCYVGGRKRTSLWKILFMPTERAPPRSLSRSRRVAS